eukprot:c15552_g1_i2.p1 GENE.c15552_g1_i2~~c15552_g1_i2.p1  ORF type:complete len:449 (+),score=199.50 c15552_g1_i2:97-1443(+)
MAESRKKLALDVYATMKTKTPEELKAADAKSGAFWVLAALELRNLKRFSESNELLEQALSNSIKHFGENSEEAIQSLQLMLDNFMLQKKFSDAEFTARKILNAHYSNGQVTRATLIESLQKVAISCDMQGKTKEAKEMIEQAVRLFESQENYETVGYATALQQLASFTDALQDHILAEQHFRKSIAVLEKVNGFESVSVASAYHGLGCCLESQGQTRWLEAEMAFRKSIDLRKKAAKSDKDLKTAVLALTFHTLAELCLKRGDVFQSMKLIGQAAKIRSEVFGNDSSEATLTKKRENEITEIWKENNNNDNSDKPLTHSEIRSGTNDINNSLIGNNCEEIIRIMKLYPKSQTIQEKSFAALQKLVDQENIAYFLKVDLVGFVFESMERHIEFANVVQNSLSLLGRLAYEDEQCLSRIREKGMDKIKFVMSKFPSRPLIQRYGDEILNY